MTLPAAKSPEISEAELTAALAEADIPVLLMVLVHLTGDRRWIEAPYLPLRDLSFFADESGGLSDEVQQTVRDAARDAILAHCAGKLTPPPEPDEALYHEMMTICVGEPMPPEYVRMMLEEMGLRDRFPSWHKKPAPEALQAFKVLVIGAGTSGLCAAFKLKEAGVPFTVVEKNPTFGGTWYENTYPEVGCDVPNHFYSYSFRPNPDWTDYYSKGAEIEAYIETCVREFGVLDHIRFETEVLSAAYDDGAALWKVTLRMPDGTTRDETANVVISATGQLNRPKYPEIEGIETFKGPIFHTACWPKDLSLEGRRVAVIGTGASAMQLARTTAEKAEHLTIFQRDAQWAIPSPNYHRSVSDKKRWLLKHVPFYGGWYRFSLVWRFSDRLLPSLKRDPDWPHPERSMNARNDRHREYLTNFIREELGDRTDLLDKVLPTYPPYGKRILVDNHWFRTIKRDDVDLITDPIARITKGGIETETGETHPADIIVLATGFQSTRLLGSLEVRGKGGQSLDTLWGDDDSRAHLGMTVPNFPNLFLLYGPNTNSGHGGSIIFIAECQVRYVMASIMRMIEGDIPALECREAAYEDYNARVDAEHDTLIWTHPGMDTWYRNKAGRIVSIMPWRLVDYWKMTAEPNPADFV
jgi:4-hydroxyacetophenone monooxygenase